MDLSVANLTNNSDLHNRTEEGYYYVTNNTRYFDWFAFMNAWWYYDYNSHGQDYWYYNTNRTSPRTINALLRFLAPFMESVPSVIASAFGIVSNAAIIFVFRRLGVLSDSCTTTLVFLALYDLGFCLTNFIFYGVEIAKRLGVYKLWPDLELYMESLAIKSTPIGAILSMTNNFAILYLALERMVRVVFPFQVKQIFNPKRSCYVHAAFFLTAFILHLPQLFYNHAVWAPGGINFTILVPTGTFDQVWIDRAHFVNNLVLRPVCIGLVIILNGVIVVQVNVLKRIRARLSQSRPHTINEAPNKTSDKSVGLSKETRLTIIMAVVSSMYVVCYSPRSILSYALTLNHIIDIFSVANGRFLKTLTQVYKPFELVNSCANIFIYYTLSSKFRQEFKIAFCSCKRRN